MRILIDGQPAESAVPTESVHDAVSQIGEKLNQSGRVILSVRVNGNLIPLEAVGRTSGSVEILEISSASTRDVAIDVLRGCSEHMPRLIDAFTDCAKKIRTGDIRGAMVIIEEAVSTWLELERGTESAMTALGLDWDDVRIKSGTTIGEAQSAGAIVREIHRLLEETQRVLESADHVELGDLLDYDLPPVLRAYQVALVNLADLGNAPRH